jgi:hypothetical protein
MITLLIRLPKHFRDITLEVILKAEFLQTLYKNFI